MTHTNLPNIPLQPTVKKLRFLPSAELARYASSVTQRKPLCHAPTHWIAILVLRLLYGGSCISCSRTFYRAPTACRSALVRLRPRPCRSFLLLVLVSCLAGRWVLYLRAFILVWRLSVSVVVGRRLGVSRSHGWCPSAPQG